MKYSRNFELITVLVFYIFSLHASEPGEPNLQKSFEESADPLSICNSDIRHNEVIRSLIELPGYYFPESQIPYLFEVYATQEKLATISRGGNLVVIVNGNGYTASAYKDFSKFLAKNGFIVAVVEREHGATTTHKIFDSIETIFEHFNLNSKFPVALIGHSMGSSVVNNVAFENYKFGYDINLKALVNMSPNAEFSHPINGFHTPAFLTMYGSRDEDMTGTTGVPHEAFMMYDRVGTEGSTACLSEPCILSEPPIEKAMVHVFGADHGSMIKNVADPRESPSSYLEKVSQFCIGKTYVSGFLKWKMRNELEYQDIVLGNFMPDNIKLIKTNNPDGYGLPSGSTLRLNFQYSPRHKRVIENFEDNVFSLGDQSEALEINLLKKTHYLSHGNPFYYRHHTNSLMLKWTDSNDYQYLSFNVPQSFSDASAFSHFSFRVGQVHGDYFPLFENEYEDIDVWVGLLDGSDKFEWTQLPATVSRTDKFSSMSTKTFALSKFESVKLNDVREVYIAIDPIEKGSLILDNLEWVKLN